VAKVIENTSIARHNAEALIIGSMDDFSQTEQDWLKQTYPGAAEFLAELAADTDWTLGRVYPMEFGEKKVVFVQICRDGKPTYEGVRDCIKKISENTKKIGAKHFAMGRLGCGDGKLHIGALEPVVAAAEGGKAMVDIYRGEGP